MFPSAHVVRHLGGVELRQDEERNPAPARSPSGRLPFGPEQPGRAAVGSGTWGLLRRGNSRGPRLLFRLSLGPKDGISMSEGSNLD